MLSCGNNDKKAEVPVVPDVLMTEVLADVPVVPSDVVPPADVPVVNVPASDQVVPVDVTELQADVPATKEVVAETMAAE